MFFLIISFYKVPALSKYAAHPSFILQILPHFPFLLPHPMNLPHCLLPELFILHLLPNPLRLLHPFHNLLLFLFISFIIIKVVSKIYYYLLNQFNYLIIIIIIIINLNLLNLHYYFYEYYYLHQYLHISDYFQYHQLINHLKYLIILYRAAFYFWPFHYSHHLIASFIIIIIKLTIIIIINSISINSIHHQLNCAYQAIYFS